MTSSADEVDRKRDIIQSAVTVFAEHGFSNATVSQVAATADVSKGTIYLYFESKPEILHEIFKQFENNLHGILDRILTESPVSETTLRETVRDLANYAQSNPDTVKVLFDFWSNSLRGEDSGPVEFQSIYRRIREKIRGVLQKGAHQGVFAEEGPEEMPFVLVGVFEGLLIHWLADPDSPSLEATTERATDVLLRGLAPSTPERSSADCNCPSSQERKCD